MCFSEAKTSEFSFKEMQIMSVKAVFGDDSWYLQIFN